MPVSHFLYTLQEQTVSVLLKWTETGLVDLQSTSPLHPHPWPKQIYLFLDLYALHIVQVNPQWMNKPDLFSAWWNQWGDSKQDWLDRQCPTNGFMCPCGSGCLSNIKIFSSEFHLTHKQRLSGIWAEKNPLLQRKTRVCTKIMKIRQQINNSGLLRLRLVWTLIQ